MDGLVYVCMSRKIKSSNTHHLLDLHVCACMCVRVCEHARACVFMNI